MTNKTPRIASFKPVVLEGQRRVSLKMAVENLPAASANVMLMMPETPGNAPRRPKPVSSASGPYPNIELSILNSQRQPVASLLIVEHKEPHTALTLHIPSPDLNEQYTARAEMSYQSDILDVVEVPFTLGQVGEPDG